MEPSPAPATGERSAVRGYRWQYDHIAALVYDALLDDDLVEVRLTDPDAGKVDDLVLVRRGGAHGYQFKSAETPSALTLRQLLASTRTRGGPGPSLIRSVSDGWRALVDRFGTAEVHLVCERFGSTNDQLGDPEGARPSPAHSAAFFERVLAPLCDGSLALEDVPNEWQHALGLVRGGTGLPEESFGPLVSSFHLELGATSPLNGASTGRRGDIIALSDALFRLVSEAKGVVELDRTGVLALVGWTGRPILRSRHDFPVDADTYSPLRGAIDALDKCLTAHPCGYVALVGPPGAGKSTLLSQALSGRPERVVRYYAYIPGSAASRTRMSGEALLHDLVVMLHQAGLSASRRELAREDLPGLRSQLAEQFDAAGLEHAETGRRTIVVIDGLDHVARDYPGGGNLLEELPLPGELPGGVVIIVGARTLSPLPARARQQVEERQAVVDLRDHKLAPSAVLDICRRSPNTAGLPQEIHLRLVELCAGHPLALSYLLNRIRDADGRDPREVLASAPPYAGDVAQEYRAIWDAIEHDPGLHSLVAVVARLRVGFTTQWLRAWAEPSAVHTWTRSVRYLFRPAHDGWRFFHDSFRQFAVDQTAMGADGFDRGADEAWHQRTAELCAASPDTAIAAEELHHRAAAAQDDCVLNLAKQETFRRQFLSLRGPDLIREDIGTALRIAAGRADVSTMLRLLLALVEAHERYRALEQVDVPGALMAAGLRTEAVAYAGDRARRVPLDHAYNLAAALGAAGDPSGRALFDAIDHEWMTDRADSRGLDGLRSASIAWAGAAARFRPIPMIFGAIAQVVESADPGSALQWSRIAEAMRREVVKVLADLGDREGLGVVADVLAHEADAAAANAAKFAPAESAAARGDDPDDARLLERLANIVSVQVDVFAALLPLGADAADKEAVGHALARAIEGRPKRHETALSAAEVLAAAGDDEAAARLLAQLGYNRALTTSDLSYSSEGHAVERRFRYWRLQHLVCSRVGIPLPVSIPPDRATPAGNGINPGAPVHSDAPGIALAARIDGSIRRLAEIDARSETSTPVPLHEAWTQLAPMLEPFRSAADTRESATYSGIARQRLPLLLTVLDVAEGHSPELLSLVADHLKRRIAADPGNWPPYLRAPLGRRLRDAAIHTEWYELTLAEQLAEADAQDVYGRLDALASLVHAHAADGRLDVARTLALRLPDAAFGVGYRKDYQFDSWVQWLGRALVSPGGERFIPDAAWLARLLVVAETQTEGAPAKAAAELPAVVAATDAIGAVRLLEFLVAHGTVSHSHALARLITALLGTVADVTSVAVATDLVTEILAPSTSEAHPDTADALVAAARRLLSSADAQSIIEATAGKVSHRALASTRQSWQSGFGIPVAPSPPSPPPTLDDYGALLKHDGTRISRSDVPVLAQTVREIMALRQQEDPSSTFSWRPVLKRRNWSPSEVAELAGAFGDGTNQSGQALAALSELAVSAGDSTLGLELSRAALPICDPNGWSGHWDGGGRRRAAAVLARIGGPAGRVAAAKDLAAQATNTDWLAAMLLPELAEVVEALDPASDFGETWPEVRDYLEGMSTSLELPDDDPLAARDPHWWIPESAPRSTSPALAAGQSADVALVDLAVRHLAHPAWLVREGAIRTVAHALTSGVPGAPAAVLRLAEAADCPEDVLEAAGLAVMGARELGLGGSVGALLDETLSASTSGVLRNLASARGIVRRPLSPLYMLSVPPPMDHAIGNDDPFLDPHHAQYALLAEGAGCDLDSVLAVAARYAREFVARLPSGTAVRNALSQASMRLAHPSPGVWASRAAFGKVLADFDDAGLLIGLPQRTLRRLRTVDPQLIVSEPVPRPPQVPPPPPAGHDQRVESWLGTLDDRLAEYVAAVAAEGWSIVAGTSRLTVLNWEALQEEVTWATAANPDGGNARLAHLAGALVTDLATPESGPLPRAGRPLAVLNSGWTLHQWAADWVCLRPDLAGALGWRPDPTAPGTWLTVDGERVVERIWWVDGWWGRSEKAFDDTEAEGHAVLVSSDGVKAIVDALGPITTTIAVVRRKPDGPEAEAWANHSVAHDH